MSNKDNINFLFTGSFYVSCQEKSRKISWPVRSYSYSLASGPIKTLKFWFTREERILVCRSNRCLFWKNRKAEGKEGETEDTPEHKLMRYELVKSRWHICFALTKKVFVWSNVLECLFKNHLLWVISDPNSTGGLFGDSAASRRCSSHHAPVKVLSCSGRCWLSLWQVTAGANISVREDIGAKHTPTHNQTSIRSLNEI